MNRRDFIKRIAGAAAAVVAGPVVLELVPQSVPAVNPAWIDAEFEAAFIIPVDELLNQTCWYWSRLSLENLKAGVATEFVCTP